MEVPPSLYRGHCKKTATVNQQRPWAGMRSLRTGSQNQQTKTDPACAQGASQNQQTRTDPACAQGASQNQQTRTDPACAQGASQNQQTRVDPACAQGASQNQQTRGLLFGPSSQDRPAALLQLVPALRTPALPSLSGHSASSSPRVPISEPEQPLLQGAHGSAGSPAVPSSARLSTGTCPRSPCSRVLTAVLAPLPCPPLPASPLAPVHAARAAAPAPGPGALGSLSWAVGCGRTASQTAAQASSEPPPGPWCQAPAAAVLGCGLWAHRLSDGCPSLVRAPVRPLSGHCPAAGSSRPPCSVSAEAWPRTPSVGSLGTGRASSPEDVLPGAQMNKQRNSATLRTPASRPAARSGAGAGQGGLSPQLPKDRGHGAPSPSLRGPGDLRPPDHHRPGGRCSRAAEVTAPPPAPHLGTSLPGGQQRRLGNTHCLGQGLGGQLSSRDQAEPPVASCPRTHCGDTTREAALVSVRTGAGSLDRTTVLGPPDVALEGEPAPQEPTAVPGSRRPHRSPRPSPGAGGPTGAHGRPREPEAPQEPTAVPGSRRPHRSPRPSPGAGGPTGARGRPREPEAPQEPTPWSQRPHRSPRPSPGAGGPTGAHAVEPEAPQEPAAVPGSRRPHRSPRRGAGGPTGARGRPREPEAPQEPAAVPGSRRPHRSPRRPREPEAPQEPTPSPGAGGPTGAHSRPREPAPQEPTPSPGAGGPTGARGRPREPEAPQEPAAVPGSRRPHRSPRPSPGAGGPTGAHGRPPRELEAPQEPAAVSPPPGAGGPTGARGRVPPPELEAPQEPAAVSPPPGAGGPTGAHIVPGSWRPTGAHGRPRELEAPTRRPRNPSNLSCRGRLLYPCPVLGPVLCRPGSHAGGRKSYRSGAPAANGRDRSAPPMVPKKDAEGPRIGGLPRAHWQGLLRAHHPQRTVPPGRAGQGMAPGGSALPPEGHKNFLQSAQGLPVLTARGPLPPPKGWAPAEGEEVGTPVTEGSLASIPYPQQ
ncbi:collagen alpha-1(I) chain-like [Saccopteryx bilineata]|uniref:collagen alpha-1(I) chain-like n=1 Tax=Saccopteryx bilineata TaxID=59482 RepID=UPI00338DA9A5